MNNELAEKIADALFTSGQGTKADQLRLYRENDYLAGWGYVPAIDQIQSVLDAEVAPRTSTLEAARMFLRKNIPDEQISDTFAKTMAAFADSLDANTGWIPGRPNDTGKYLFALENKDGTRKVALMNTRQLWADMKIIAHMPLPKLPARETDVNPWIPVSTRTPSKEGTYEVKYGDGTEGNIFWIDGEGEDWVRVKSWRGMEGSDGTN